jgi:hypothetical protein
MSPLLPDPVGTSNTLDHWLTISGNPRLDSYRNVNVYISPSLPGVFQAAVIDGRAFYQVVNIL